MSRLFRGRFRVDFFYLCNDVLAFKTASVIAYRRAACVDSLVRCNYFRLHSTWDGNAFALRDVLRKEESKVSQNFSIHQAGSWNR